MTILTVDEFREHVSTGLGDDAVQRLLDAAELEIVRFAGDPDSAEEILDGYGRSRFITLRRPAASITSVTESWPWNSTLSLAADDYILYPDGLVLERIRGGTHSSHAWRGRVRVQYVPEADVALRQVVQIDLVNLCLDYHPGVTSETIGSWTEQFSAAIEANREEVDGYLSRLKVGPTMFVVG